MLITKKIGTAPGTTTLNLGMVVDDDWFMTGRGAKRDPGYYAENFRPSTGGLGMVLDPMQVNRSVGHESFGASSTILESKNVPNDAELSAVYGYTPVHAGWTHMNGLGDSMLGLSTEEAMEKSLQLQKRQTNLQLIATVALTSMALFSIITGLIRVNK